MVYIYAIYMPITSHHKPCKEMASDLELSICSQGAILSGQWKVFSPKGHRDMEVWEDFLEIMGSGQIIATSHDLGPQKVAGEGKSPLCQGNLGWSDGLYLCSLSLQILKEWGMRHNLQQLWVLKCILDGVSWHHQSMEKLWHPKTIIFFRFTHHPYNSHHQSYCIFSNLNLNHHLPRLHPR